MAPTATPDTTVPRNTMDCRYRSSPSNARVNEVHKQSFSRSLYAQLEAQQSERRRTFLHLEAILHVDARRRHHRSHRGGVTMQASKIKIGDEYAVTVKDQDTLALIRVTKVVTTRTGPHSADFTHRIFGMVDDQLIECHPDRILGPYQEHAELVAQRKAEADAKRDAAIERDLIANALVEVFYRLINVERPDSKLYSRQMFDTSYGSEVKINAEGAKLLLAALNQKPSLKIVS